MNIYEILELALAVPGREIKMKNLGDKICLTITDLNGWTIQRVFKSNVSLRPIKDMLAMVIRDDT